MAQQMRCFQIKEFGVDLTESNVTLSELSDSGVRLKVLAAGVCHSDVHICEGHYDLGGGDKLLFTDRIRLPRTLGHEVSGEVIQIGSSVKDITVGDICLVCSWIGCMKCELCKQGLENLCQNPQFIGVNRDGGFAEYVDVPHERYLVKLDGLDPVAAAPMVCSGLTTYSALKKFGPLEQRGPLVIIGAGGLGLIAIAVARMLGATGVITVELDEAKRQAALDAGATHAIDPTAPDAVEAIRTAVGGRVWGVLDVVGHSQTVQLALNVLDKVGQLIVVGLFGGAVSIPVPSFPLKVLTIQGSYTGSPSELREFIALAKQLGLPEVPLDRRPLSSAPQAIRDLQEGRVLGRIVLTP
ncbi:alcohol dehydrogenase [Advenella kashmirensis]